MPVGVKFGVYVPEGLAEDLERCMKELGLDNKSKLVQEALRSFIAEQRWRFGGRAVGVIGVIYDHDVSHADEELTDIQHEYLGIIVAALHIHVERRKCALYIFVRGETDDIKELMSRIMKIKGVEIVKPMLLSAD